MKRRFGLGFLAVLALVASLRASEPDFRTNINPALLYFQAFQNFPQLSEADSNYLLDAWTVDDLMEEKRLRLLKQFDNTFKLVRRARYAKVPCDWGYDLSDGPEALLPGLAPAKRVAQVARLRAGVALEQGDFKTMSEDLSSAFILARQLSTDRILISCLVQNAIEYILTSAVMENYYRLSADELAQLVAAFDAAPRRGTVAETIGGTERDAFFGYIQRKVNGIIAVSHSNEQAFWAEFAKFWNPVATESEVAGARPDPDAEVMKDAAGDTSAGLLRLLNEMPALYVETARVLALPYPEYKAQSGALFEKITNSPNPFVKHFFSVFRNVRAKEFGVMVRLEMIRAAAAYKRDGTKAMESVKDPLTGQSFEFSRVQANGVDRGFKLKCKEQFRDFEEVAIFIEKAGPPLHLDGKNAGTLR